MTGYLPDVYQQFERRFPAVKATFDSLGAAEHEAEQLAQKERRLVKLGVAVGVESEGSVRSHVRNLLGIGTSQEEIYTPSSSPSRPSGSLPPTRPPPGDRPDLASRSFVRPGRVPAASPADPVCRSITTYSEVHARYRLDEFGRRVRLVDATGKGAEMQSAPAPFHASVRKKATAAEASRTGVRGWTPYRTGTLG
jgi:hypothetical protein